MRFSFFTILLLLALLAAGFIGMIAYWTFSPTTGDKASETPKALSLNTQPPTRPVLSSTDPIRGDLNASFSIIEFGDFQCAACAEVEPLLRKVLDQYPGRVKLVWKDAPNSRLHPLAQRAAEAAHCAGEQGKFWEYHDRLLDQGQSLTETGLSLAARELGLNGSSFAECLESGRATELVTRSLNEALLLRVDATPYFFLGESRISGAVNEEELKKMLTQ